MTTELSQRFKITHKFGMHARASAKFVELTQSFRSQVFLSRDGSPEVDGRSIMGILTLGVQLGDEILVRVVGEDAERAMAAISALVNADFHGL